MRKYYSCVICKPGEDYCDKIYQVIQAETAFVFHEDSANHGEYYNIKSGDIIILSYQRNLVAYGEATGITDRQDDEGWTLAIPVKEWYYYNENNHSDGIHRYGIGFNHSGSNRDLIKQLDEEFAIKKLEEINNHNPLFDQIIKEQENNQAQMDYQKVVNLLKFKKQIILQGPPGTGKTRLAEILAKDLTQPKTIGNPAQIIDDFFRQFNPKDEKVISKRKEVQLLLDTFQNKFPKEKLKDLSLDEYCIGTGSNDSFCWWIERGLQPLGYYFPGTSKSYRIYWNKAGQEYSKHGSLVKDITDDEEAMKKVAALLDKIVNKDDPNEGKGFLGNSLILKILNSYYPEKYFPVNGKAYLQNALKLLNQDVTKLDEIELNKVLTDIFQQKRKQFNTDVTPFEFMVFLFSTFDLENGTPIASDQTAIAKGEYHLVQFHPSYSYEDFVRGIIASATENGQVNYEVENKILADFARKAIANQNGNYVLIIDEINRANLPSVLGELIYALEYRERPVVSMYEYEGDRNISLPNNLFIIGTMNTADRSVGHIDYALRRRFAFTEVLPQRSVIESFNNSNALRIFDEMATLFCKEYKESEQSLENSDYLVNDFKPTDIMLGHSYFLVKDDAELQMRLEYEIKPLLREYLKDGILLETARNKIEDLSVS